MRSPRNLAGLVLAVLVALIVWWANADGPDGTEAAPTPEASSTQPGTTGPSGASEAEGASEPGGTDPASGLAWITVDDLPPEGRDTLALIDRGGPYPFDRDGAAFENREGFLPDRQTGYYREFTVETPGSDDRGARRIVAGAGGDRYYTADHYDSFTRIAR